MNEFNIAGRMIGDNHPPIVIAEIGINHEGSLDGAIALADAAINSGAEIVKHQTHIVEDEMSMEAKLVIPANADTSIYEIIERCANFMVRFSIQPFDSCSATQSFQSGFANF